MSSLGACLKKYLSTPISPGWRELRHSSSMYSSSNTPSSSFLVSPKLDEISSRNILFKQSPIKLKIAVVGGGFTGLTAALRLTQKKQEVTLFEKEKNLGGLAVSFKRKGWDWPIEQHYHHWFTNDTHAISLISELGLSKYLFFPDSLTSVYFGGKIYPFNKPSHILGFTPLPFKDRIRLGLVSLYLKILPRSFGEKLEKYRASDWIRKYYGEKTYKIVWEPLLSGKFGPPAGGFADKVNMAWFWARVKKRTLKLGYLQGGYQRLIDRISEELTKNGCRIFLNTSFDPERIHDFDKVLFTTPSPVFFKMFPDIDKDYRKKFSGINHLHALNLLLITKEKILKDTYWLNINDTSFPFLAVIAQTNLADAKNYGNCHLTWVGNYLPSEHLYLKKSKLELFKIYLPFLEKIAPHFDFQKITSENLELFLGPFAQPIFPLNYSRLKPDIRTPISNLYLANMDMVYPWDRGTNYAIELGERAAEEIAIPP